MTDVMTIQPKGTSTDATSAARPQYTTSSRWTLARSPATMSKLLAELSAGPIQEASARGAGAYLPERCSRIRRTYPRLKQNMTANIITAIAEAYSFRKYWNDCL